MKRRPATVLSLVLALCWTPGVRLAAAQQTGGSQATPGSSAAGQDFVPLAAPAPLVPTPIAALGLGDPTAWEVWWAFNREPVLGLRAAIEGASVRTGDGGDFLGRGREHDSFGRPHTGLVRERVVPELLAALADEADPVVRVEILIALARIGAAQAGSDLAELELVFTRHLAHAELRVAESAALALGILARPDAVQTLEHVLADGDEGRKLLGRDQVPERMRSFAALALGLVAWRSNHEDARRYAALRLAEVVERAGESIDLRVACVTALGLDPLAPRERAVGNVDHDRATSSREALVAVLLERLGDTDESWQVRTHSATAAARLAGGAPAELRAEVVAVLIEIVGPRSKAPEEVRRGAILALGRLGNAGGETLEKQVRSSLMHALRNGPAPSREFALVALGRASGRAGSGDEPFAGTEAARAELLGRTEGTSSTTRSWAALGLGLLERGVREGGGARSKASAAGLRKRLRDKSGPSERAALGIALGLCGDGEAFEALLAAFEDLSDEAGRGSLAVALGLLGDERAIEALREVRRGALHRPLLLQEVSIGLVLLRDRELVPELIGELDESTDLASRSALANALAYVGDERCVPVLLRLLHGATSDRVAAARSLGRVCEPRSLPWTVVLTDDVDYLATTESLAASGIGLLDAR